MTTRAETLYSGLLVEHGENMTGVTRRLVPPRPVTKWPLVIFITADLLAAGLLWVFGV